MNQSTIPKLNKKLIYVCLLGAATVAVPLIVIPMAGVARAGDDMSERVNAKVFVGDANDAFALSGTEHFPKTYAGVHDFEKAADDASNVKDVEKHDQLLEALDKLNNLEHKMEGSNQHAHSDGAYYDDDDPWREAKKSEQKRRAFEHYDARRSDIMFVNNAKRSGSSNDATMDTINRTLEIAEKQMNQEMERGDMFFQRTSGNSSRGPVGKIKEAQAYMVSEGTLIPTILLSEIDTSLPGPILARVSQNIWDSKTGKHLLIPQNSQLIGEYDSSIGHGQTRAQIVWKRVIFPNQQSVNLGEMVGVDKRGTSGTAGSVDNHYDKVALGLILTTALSGSVRMTQGKYDAQSSSMSQEFGNTLAQESARLGNKIADKMLSIKPTIKVPMGKRLNVFVEQDLSLQPYAG